MATDRLSLAVMTPRLTATDLACRRGDRVLFRGLSFALKPREVLHITGANGIGKSSLLRILAGLLGPYAGSVERRDPVGLLDEKPALDPDQPLSKALAFWRAIDGTPSTNFPWDVEHLLDVPVRYLSTGQRKRAALARLSAQAAPIWLLDEPLNGLDHKGVSAVGAMVEGHCRADGICVLASHQPFPLDGMRVLDLSEFVP
ncbi:heme ABC exporter ATP-binding protein CcmA [Altererythrobacter sp. BO-6]|uniref:heme ABC exporter ATP-binding protein CcmA n=1 Tax=Altererythrobacter sp. BO-6 TaxID=2604537 RepID=UPI001F49EFAF|nr:heme ABC exporter ATP-binding protein CcmA [Altererythrobacter sp. BO-6]